ncbi:hypothetical protein GCM10023165_47770 [Variovorax defluvii]|uniref:Uncharacterized protein n=1 Tax=Variovorax defluvii TaxID=913761 RepID=A0ABP8IBY9_9BURK
MPGHLNTDPQQDGVFGSTTASGKVGVFGSNEARSAPTGGGAGGAGVFGLSVSPGAAGVFGANNSAKGVGVQGNGPERGVSGWSPKGFGAVGQSDNSSGVLATSKFGQGLTAYSDNDVAVFAQGATFAGVFNGAVVVNKGPAPKDTGRPASDINGSIVINDGNLFVNKGDVILSGADCAEDFELLSIACAEPGSVLVIAADGSLDLCRTAYDHAVAGVVSGAGSFRPGMILGRTGPTNRAGRAPVALIGRVYCKVEAFSAPIKVGDLLTTSAEPGHAMKAIDAHLTPGAVLGKAMAPMLSGRGLIPILVTLQ